MSAEVTVWHDSTSAEHGWIVDIDDNGSSSTVEVFDTESEARVFANKLAEERGLPFTD